MLSDFARGLIPEDHELAFLNARSKAFTEADVVLAVGTRFNWVIQFGRPPRFAADLKVIHVDVNPGQLGHNRPVDVPIFVKTLLGAHNWVGVWYKPEGRLNGVQIADMIADTMLRGVLKESR